MNSVRDMFFKAAGLKTSADFNRMRKKKIVKIIFDAVGDGCLEKDYIVFQEFWGQDFQNRQTGKLQA